MAANANPAFVASPAMSPKPLATLDPRLSVSSNAAFAAALSINTLPNTLNNSTYITCLL
jgi:hypothetical protein